MKKNTTKLRPSIGIIGQGFIGLVLKRYYENAKVYDIRPGEWNSLDEVLSCDYVFVAVNMLDNCRSRESRAILEKYFKSMPDGVTVIMKSTIVPGTTDYFQIKYPHLRFVYNPEFLTEATAWDDFIHAPFQILGLTPASLELKKDLYRLLPRAPVNREMDARDAEFLKHCMNSFFAMKVSFFNQMYDASIELGAHYEPVREVMVQHPSVGNSHSIIWHKGYRGFGGKCLPKDVEALSSVANFPLLNEIIKFNDKLRSESVPSGDGIVSEHAEAFKQKMP